jgi:hypothetical protein
MKQYCVSETDFKILASVYRLLKGRRSNVINRQMILEDSGVPSSTLSERIGNYYLKVNLLNQDKEIK